VSRLRAIEASIAITLTRRGPPNLNRSGTTARYGSPVRRRPPVDVRPDRRALLEDEGVRVAGGRVVPRRAHRDARLDIGCGNGRHTELLAERADAVVGVDLSRELLREAVARARERGTTGPRRSSTATPRPSRSRPMRSGSPCTSRPSHHLPSREARVRSLDELARVLAPGGTALVSAWSTAHDRFDREEGFDTTVDWTLPGRRKRSRGTITSTRPLSSRSTSAKAPSASSMSIFPAGTAMQPSPPRTPNYHYRYRRRWIKEIVTTASM